MCGVGGGAEEHVDGGLAEILRRPIEMGERIVGADTYDFQMHFARREIDVAGAKLFAIDRGGRRLAGQLCDLSRDDLGEVRRHVQHDDDRDVLQARPDARQKRCERLGASCRGADDERPGSENGETAQMKLAAAARDGVGGRCAG